MEDANKGTRHDVITLMDPAVQNVCDLVLSQYFSAVSKTNGQTPKVRRKANPTFTSCSETNIYTRSTSFFQVDLGVAAISAIV